jgi:hypothetical protein
MSAATLILRGAIKRTKPFNFFTAHVALMCDADMRASHSGVNYVADMVSVHAMHEAYQRRMAKAARFGRKAVAK